MVFNEVDCNLYFIARDKFIQHDIIIGMGIGKYNRIYGYRLDIISQWHNASWKEKSK